MLRRDAFIVIVTVFVAAVVGSVTGSSAAPAKRAPLITYASAAISVGDDVQGMVDADCGTRRAIGGGLVSSASPGGSSINSIGRSHVHFWSAFMDNHEFDDSTNTLHAYAVCGKVKPDFHTTVAEADPSGTVTVDAHCGAHERVIGGAAVANGGFPSHTTLTSSFPIDSPDARTVPDDGWRVKYTSQAHDQLFGTAICVHNDDFQHFFYKRSAQKSVPGHDARALGVDCPAHTHVVGGGGRITGGAHALQETDPDHPRGLGWEVYATTLKGSPAKARAYAICVS